MLHYAALVYICCLRPRQTRTRRSFIPVTCYSSVVLQAGVRQLVQVGVVSLLDVLQVRVAVQKPGHYALDSVIHAFECDQQDSVSNAVLKASRSFYASAYRLLFPAAVRSCSWASANTFLSFMVAGYGGPFACKLGCGPAQAGPHH